MKLKNDISMGSMGSYQGNFSLKTSLRSEIEVSEEYLPERQLVSEVIFRALRDYLNDSNLDVLQHEARDAKAWMFSREMHPFSFLWCCQTLDVNPNIIREKALHWRASGFKIIV